MKQISRVDINQKMVKNIEKEVKGKSGKDFKEKEYTEFKEVCSRLFGKINERCFSNSLPKYGFKINRRLKTTSAQVLFSKKIIEMNLGYHRKYPEELKDTIKHEMIHIFLEKNNMNPNHFKDFKKIAKKMGVNRYAKF